MSAQLTGLALRLPAGWQRVSRSEADNVAWRSAYIPLLPEASRAEMDTDIARVTALIAADSRLTREWAVLLVDQSPSRVAAVLTLDYYSADGTAYETYKTAVEAGPAKDSSIFTGRIVDTQLGAGPSVVIHDFIVNSSAQHESALHERYLAAVFPADSDVMIQVQLTTHDLNLFGDIVKYGNKMLDGLAMSRETE
jgi:hypothetical protein